MSDNDTPTPDDITVLATHLRRRELRDERRRTDDDRSEDHTDGSDGGDEPTGPTVTSGYSGERFNPVEMAREAMWQDDPLGMAMAHPLEAAGRLADSIGEMIETGMNSAWGGESSDDGESSGGDDADADGDGVDDNEDPDGGLGGDTVEAGDLEEMPGLLRGPTAGIDPAIVIDLDDARLGGEPVETVAAMPDSDLDLAVEL